VRGLITAELALSLVLLAGAGLLIESFFRMGSEPLGFQPRGLAVAEIRLPPSRYADSASRLALYDRALSRLGTGAIIATSFPPDGAGIYQSFFRQGVTITDSADVRRGGRRIVSANYFTMLETHLLRGRVFDDRDRAASEPVAVINESLTRELFEGSEPIGQMLAIGAPGNGNPWRRIVGVVADQKTSSSYHQIGWVERPEAFEPLTQAPPLSVRVALRGTPSALRAGLEALDAGVAISDVQTMDQHLNTFLAYPRLRALLLSAFAALALLLAGVGLYSVLRQFVVERRREIGVRVAIGARPRDVVRLIGRQAGRPVVVGIGAGVLGTLALGRYLASLLYHVAPADAPLLIGVCLVMLAVAVLAVWFPARRAARADPLVAIRAE
jgi:predicted permease